MKEIPLTFKPGKQGSSVCFNGNPTHFMTLPHLSRLVVSLGGGYWVRKQGYYFRMAGSSYRLHITIVASSRDRAPVI